MAVGSTANWYVQNNPNAANQGSDNNGSGFDSGLAGAGTNYALRATAILSLTDLACTSGSTTLTSATGGFTAAMIGNAIHITTTGTGAHFVIGYYFITAVGSSTSVTLDRTPTTGGNGAAGTGAVGGSGKTIGQMTGSNSPAVGGNTIYIAPGVYREQNTISLNPGSVITIQGDPGNTQQFTDGVPGVAIPAGECRVTNYNTNDTTAATATALITTSSKSNLTFSSFNFVSGANVALLNLTNGSSLTFNDCLFNICIATGGAGAINLNPPVDTTSNWAFNRCIFVSASNAAAIVLPSIPTSTTADYSTGLSFTNCFFIGGNRSASITASGANSFKGGGISFNCCHMLFFGTAGVSTAANLSTTFPVTVNNCLLFSEQVTGLNANALGQITEDYCRILCNTPRTNVTAGTHSISDASYAMLMEFGQSWFAKRQWRPMFSPSFDSPLLAFGALSSPPSVDLLNLPKPSGAGQTWASANGAVGCYERQECGTQSTAQLDSGRTYSLNIKGPGTAARLRIPVTNVSTTIAIKVYRDSTYAGSNPQIVLEAANEIGVATQTVTDTGAASTWNTLTLSAITPSANGVVVLRLVSQDTAGNGNVYWDTVTIT